MTTFWCSWCGATARASSPDSRVACRRCAVEFFKLVGFAARTDMVPLHPGETPPEPAAATKQFVFVDAETGNVVGSTERIPRRLQRRGA